MTNLALTFAFSLPANNSSPFNMSPTYLVQKNIKLCNTYKTVGQKQVI